MCVSTYLCGNMANITLYVPEKIRKDMKQFSEIRWSEVARKAIIERLETLKMAEKIASKSKLTEKDVEEFSRKLKRNARKRFIS